MQSVLGKLGLAEENAGVFRNRHGTAINSPNRESLDQAGKEKSERKNQRETVTRTAEVHQGVGDKREAEKTADDFQIAEEYETGGKITLSQPAGECQDAGDRDEAECPVIPRKVPADFSLANHDAPEALPPKCPKKKRWVLVDTARAVPYRLRVRKGRQGIEKARIGERAQA